MRRLLSTLILLTPVIACAQSDPVSRSWNQPVEPFRIAGNLYYVGASDITSFLITTPAGHFLIDGGFAETAGQIRANVEKLGFRVKDIRILLSSHAHYDHAGGLSEMRRASGARLLVSEREIPLLARGGLDDPQFGGRFPFQGVRADAIVRHGVPIALGGTKLTPYITPGHTPGCTTWSTTVMEGKRKLEVVFLCSMSVPAGYRLIGNERYPNAVEDYRSTFRLLKTLRADIPLGSHGNFFDLEKKTAALNAGARENPFIDPAGYRSLVEAFERRCESMVVQQSEATERSDRRP